MSRGIQAAAALAAGAATAAALGVTAAHSDTTTPSWNCRASLAYVDVKGLDRIEPLAANSNSATPSKGTEDRAQCADDDQPVPRITTTTPLKLDATVVQAQTRIAPAVGAARDQTASGDAKAADITLAIPNTALTLAAKAVHSSTSAKCVNGVPALSGTSTIAELTLGGQKIPLDGAVTQVAAVLNGTPLSMLARVLANQQIKTGDTSSATQTLTQQAARVELLTLGGAPLVTVVVGESKVSRTGKTCAAPEPPKTTTVTTPGSTTTVTTPGKTTTVTTPGETTAVTTPGETSTVTTPGETTPGQTKTVTTAANASPTGAVLAKAPVVKGESVTVSPGVKVNGVNGGCGKLSMAIGGRSSYRGRYGKRLVLRGRIVSCTGKAIKGARIDLYHVVAGKALLKTGLRSRANGRLTLILPLNVTTRTLRFEYRGDLNSTKVSSRRLIRLTIRSRHGRLLSGRGPGS